MSYSNNIKTVKMWKMIYFIIFAITILFISLCFSRLCIKEKIYQKKMVEIVEAKNRMVQENLEGKTYYVSSDGTSKERTNINDPMSLKTANTKKYKGNDKILLKAGDILVL